MLKQLPSLEENIELAPASKFLLEKLKIAKANGEDRKDLVGSYLLISFLVTMKQHIEVAIAENTDPYSNLRKYLAKDFLSINLSRLSSIAQQYPIVRTALRNYTERLGELAKKEESLREVYASYKKTFGGKE